MHFECNIDTQIIILLCSFVDHIVPTPIVSVTALDEIPVVGKSFSMECNVTVAKGIIGSVDIMWIINGTVTRRVKDTIEDISSEYTLHRDVYNIAQLQLSDNNTVYYCMAVTSASKHVEGNDSITLTIGKSIASLSFTMIPKHIITHTCVFACMCA